MGYVVHSIPIPPIVTHRRSQRRWFIVAVVTVHRVLLRRRRRAARRGHALARINRAADGAVRVRHRAVSTT